MVRFTQTYPGKLVPKLDKPIPAGTEIVLPAAEALELRRVFGFVELRPFRKEANP